MVSGSCTVHVEETERPALTTLRTRLQAAGGGCPKAEANVQPLWDLTLPGAVAAVLLVLGCEPDAGKGMYDRYCHHT